MCKLILALIASLAFASSSAYAETIEGDCDGAKMRIVQFLKNAHTGKKMSAENWMVDEVRRAPMLAGFGGLDALVNQTTAQARKFGGLKSIDVQKASRIGETCEISAVVKFVKEPKNSLNSAVAANEPMVWTFQLNQQHGVWKIVR